MRAVVFAGVILFVFVSVASAEKVPARGWESPLEKTPLNASPPGQIYSSGDTSWLYVGQGEEGGVFAGGENTGGPGWEETFTFYGLDPCAATGAFPLSGRCFYSVDVRTLPAPDDRYYWHLDAYQACGGAGESWWCGTPTGGLCETWDNAAGYGDDWKQYLALEPDLAGVSPGDTVALACQVCYDTECDYDYAYLAYSNDRGASWMVLATFNGTSRGYPIPEGQTCAYTCGDDYFESGDCNRDPGVFPKWNAFPRTDRPGSNHMIVGDPDSFFVGFLFESDVAWSDQDGRGDTDGAFFVDEVLVATLEGAPLEFEDMDTDYEPEKWHLVRPPGIADFWALHHDPDPPLEPDDPGNPGICVGNATSMWAAAPYLNGVWRIPTEANGFHYRLMTPAISRDWLPDVDKDNVGVVFQYDLYACTRSNTCDWPGLRTRQYREDLGGWCDWQKLWTWMEWEHMCESYFVVDLTSAPISYFGDELVQADSIQFAWDLYDTGNTGDFCWTTQYPPPHKNTQMLVDNVSIGLYDRSATSFYVRHIDLFQDTFDLETPAHNALLANGDMPKPVLALEESLAMYVLDPDGLAGGGASVELYYSVDRGSVWRHHAMSLSEADPIHPTWGGTYRGSITPAQAYGDASTEWDAGTEVWYYVYVVDEAGHEAWWPATAKPGTPDPPHAEWQINYPEFGILPGTGHDGNYSEPWMLGDRLLLVDDCGRQVCDFNPAMTETTFVDAEDIYEGLFSDLGWCYDKYDVLGPSYGLGNEPWGISAVDPVKPDSVVRRYDCVVWFTGWHDEYTVKDTMQCLLRGFVLDGGNLFICGHSIGWDMTNGGTYNEQAADTCGFYESLLGAHIDAANPESKPGVQQPHWYGVGTGIYHPSDLDTFHFHTGCPISVSHDLARINPTPAEPWANPEPFLVYPGPYSAGDTLLAICNDVSDGGKVVYMSMDMTAIVDSTHDRGTQGRAQLVNWILRDFFGHTPRCVLISGVTEDREIASSYSYCLDQNHPNPFNPETDIDYSIRDRGQVRLTIYDVQGRLVRTLVDYPMQPGRYHAHWDGTNERGRLVSTGIYFCRMEAGDFSATRKMVLLK